jgi:O-antigen/teichoic acid export membrane protein
MTANTTRSGLLRRAVLTSLSGKAVTVVTQLLAIPMSIGALGMERYGAYAMLVAAFIWAQAASTLVGSALTLKLVQANADQDRPRESALFSTAFFFAVMVSVVLSIGLQAATEWLDFGRLFGLQEADLVRELRIASYWMAWIIPLNVVLSLAEAAHAGYQKQYINNLLTMAANAVGLFALLLLVRIHPSIVTLVLAMFLPAVVARIVNLLLLLRSHPFVMPAWRHFNGSLLIGMLIMGAAFGVTQIGSFFYQQFTVFYVGRESSTTEAAYFATMMVVVAMSGNVLVMFTQPLMPALRDALAQGDEAWIRRAHALTLRRLVPYVCMATILIALTGSELVSALTRHPADIDWTTQVLWALFFGLVAWEHIHYSFLVGLGRLWLASLLYTAGSLLMLVTSLYLVPAHGIAGAFAAMCIGPTLCTVIAFPVAIRRRIASLDSTTLDRPATASA